MGITKEDGIVFVMDRPDPETTSPTGLVMDAISDIDFCLKNMRKVVVDDYWSRCRTDKLIAALEFARETLVMANRRAGNY